MYDESAVPHDEAESTREAIAAFMREKFPAVTAFMVTIRKDGRPSIRQVSTFIEGWTIGTISQATHLKNTHIRRNPLVTYLFVGLEPNSPRSVKNVMVQGVCEIVEDQAEVQAFVERRAAANSQPAPAESKYTRYLLRTRPNLLRAEGFTGPRRPVILTEFPE